MAFNPSAGLHSVVVYDDCYEQNGTKYFLISAQGPQGPSGGAWQVRRRYNDFERLHDQLARHGIFLPPMPPKSFFRLMMSEDFRQERRMQLEHVLQAALQCDPSLLCLQELRAFLGLTPAAGAHAAPIPPFVPIAQAMPVMAQALAAPRYAQPAAPAPVAYANPVGAYSGTGLAYPQSAPAYGFAAPVHTPAPIPMYSTPFHHHSHKSGHMAAAVVGGGVAGLIGGMMLESVLD